MKHVHLIAIGGIGMGSLAGLLKEKGYQVSGSDQALYPPMSDQLRELGIEVKIGFGPQNIEPQPDLVIVGNAVSKNNPEVVALLERKIPYYSMPQALEELFLKDRVPVVIAGTHGKTTTTALTAWILDQCGLSPGFLVGGIVKNFSKSFQIGKGRHFVVEGDEYDSAFFDKGPKFLHYHPKILVLNPVEFDHADIYKDLSAILSAFGRLVTGLPEGSVLLAHASNPQSRLLASRFKGHVITFGLDLDADLRADPIRLEGRTTFNVVSRGTMLGEIECPLSGRYNIENCLAAIAVSMECGAPFEGIRAAVASFQGVRRRQEVLGEFNGITLIDDFAHHPTAIRETLEGIRAKYPGRRLWAVFEPRSNTTRRRIFQNDFPSAFGAADQVMLGPVYQAEKIPLEERLDPEKIVNELRAADHPARFFGSVDGITTVLGEEVKGGDVVCVMSNGPFGDLCRRLVTRWGG